MQLVVLEEDVGTDLVTAAEVHRPVGIPRVEGVVLEEVIGVLLGDGLPPVEGVVAFDIEVVAERLGIGQGRGNIVVLLILDDILVQQGLPRRQTVGIVVGRTLVDLILAILREIEVDIGCKGTAGDAETLAEQEESLRAEILVDTDIVLLGVVALDVVAAQVVIAEALGLVVLRIVTAAEADARLEEDRGVLGELVLQAEAEVVAVTIGDTVAPTVLQNVTHRLVGEGRRFGIGKRAAVVVVVVASELRPVVEEVGRGVQAAHVVGADAAHAHHAAHHAAAHHVAHHVAGEVGGTLDIGIVGVEDEGDLRVVGEAPEEGVAGEAPVIEVVVLGRDVVADTCGDAADDALHHALRHGEVDDRLLLSVVNAGKLGLLGLLADDLELLDQLGGDVLRGDLGIVQEERLALDRDLAHGLAIDRDRTVVGNLDARHLLEEVDQVVVVGRQEGRGVVLDGILLDDHGVADGGDFRGVEILAVQLHLDLAEIDVLGFHLDLLGVGLVAQQLGDDDIRTVTHGFERESTFVVRQHVLRGFVLAIPGQGDGGETERLAGRLVDQHSFDGLGGQAKPQQHSRGEQEQFSKLHTITFLHAPDWTRQTSPNW